MNLLHQEYTNNQLGTNTATSQLDKTSIMNLLINQRKNLEYFTLLIQEGRSRDAETFATLLPNRNISQHIITHRDFHKLAENWQANFLELAGQERREAIQQMFAVLNLQECGNDEVRNNVVQRLHHWLMVYDQALQEIRLHFTEG